MNTLRALRLLHALRSLAVLAFAVLAAPAPAQVPAAEIQLVPVVDGLAGPIFVTHAGDGSNRLFIAELPGLIRVLQPGSSTPAIFLDIQSKVLSGGEQGLLGLAFHPQYRSNGRFFVNYTRPDFSIVIAEYRVSPADPNLAQTAETEILTIPHPVFGNHNGGMIAFGPDGYLYIGVGDGGANNDPSANAQNINVLLGKILRIDVDPPPGSGARYVSPPTNPFFGAIPGRDEIYAYGMRNPWRFSFDRGGNRAQWVGDVGEGVWEEVNTPIVNGGNYGWRVYEAHICSGLDPTLCNAPNLIPPLFDYIHDGGRCSIVGGYVYRGTQGALPAGTYVYGDFCSTEILGWDGSAQRVLLVTGMNISSFGEDEQGEIYVADIVGGTISRLVSADSGIATAVEYYYADWNHYFVTTFPDEIALLDSGGFGGNWQRSGETFPVWSREGAGLQPACRFFSTSFAPRSSHFYTPYPAECAAVKSDANWQYEGIAFHLQLPDSNGMCPPRTVTLFRLYNNGMGGAPNHRYTTRAATLAQMVAAGWTFEGHGTSAAFACAP